MIDVVVEPSGPMRRGAGAACLGTLANGVGAGGGPSVLPPSRDMTPPLSNRRRAKAETESAQFQSAPVGVACADKARLLAGLRTSHRQLYVS